MQVRSIDQIADADRGAEPVISEPLKMIDEVLAREVFLCHRAVPIVLVTKVTVEIDLCRHHRLAGQIHMLRICGNLHFSATPYACELAAVDNESRILDGSAITCDEPRSFIYGHAGRAALSKRDRNNDQEKQRHASECAHKPPPERCQMLGCPVSIVKFTCQITC